MIENLGVGLFRQWSSWGRRKVVDLEATQAHNRRFLETVDAKVGVERENESDVWHGGQSQLQKQVCSLGNEA